MNLLFKRYQWFFICVALLNATMQGYAQDCSTFDITTVSVDQISCFGITNGRIIVECTGGELPYSVSINNGVDFTQFTGTTAMIPGLSAGDYHIIVTDANQCSVSFTDNPVEIIEPDLLQLELEITRQGCPGDQLGEITAIPSGGTMPYTFFWSNGATTESIDGLDPGLYACTLSDAGACKVSSDINYSDFDEVILDAGENVEILPGETIQLDVTINIQDFSIIQWNPVGGLSDANTLNPFASPQETTTYELFIISANGCTGTDEITIFVSENQNDLVIPNAFSPNEDDLNDMFKPIFSTGSELKLMMVFNRWGQAVFKSTSTLGWDGSYLGVQQPIGTYLYTIEYFDPNGQTKFLTGEVNLVR